MYKSVLVPIDRGLRTNKACIREARKVTDPQGEIHCVFVKLDSIQDRLPEQESIDSPIDKIEEYAEESDHDYITKNITGDPSEEISKYAKQNSMELIVMNTYNPSGIKKLIRGSVTEKTIDKAPCPVLVLS
jgi:nucleotide-binding universal stress UspA family protein